jgi:hypothetical protein
MSLAYKPVCSSEGVVYPNMEALKCAALRNPERSEYTDKFYKFSGVIPENMHHSNVVPNKFISVIKTNFRYGLSFRVCTV